MDIYQTKAQFVVDAIVKNKGLESLGSDRPFLDFIMELIKELLPVLIQCFATPAEAAKELRTPGMVTKVRLRLGIRRALRDDDSVNLLAGPLFQSMLAVAKTTTDEEVKEMAASF